MSETAKSAAVATLVSVAYAFWAVPAVTAIAAYGTAIDAPRQALEAADSLLAADVESAGAAEGFGPSLADDALFLAPGLDVTRGRDAIRSMLAVRWSGPVTLKLHRVASGRSGDGGLGYTFGWIEQRSAGAVEYPKYLAAWRAEGGRWRVQAFALAAGSGRPSPAPPGDPVLAGYHGTASPGDPARLATEVAGADRSFAALATAETTCAAFTAFADPNAVGFGRADFRWGIESVRAAHSACTRADRGTWAPLAAAAAASGDLGYTVGQATLSTGPSSYSKYLKYLTVWTRQADGQWKWLLDAGNPRPAPSRTSRDLTREPGDRHVER